MTTPPFDSGQNVPLLITKLHIPPVRPGLVSRPRLIERLNAGLHRKLTLVSAPAGSGKTTLVSEWTIHLRPEVKLAWLSLDEGDDDAARFLAYVIAALQTIDENLGQTAVSLLQFPQAATPPPALENVMTLLINDLATLPVQAVLVLDDYHVINDLEINKTVAFLVDNLPPQLHLVVISREDPMLPLHRLRAQGQIVEIRAHDLRFTKDEAALFLNRTMGLNLTPADVAALEQRTEGWVAGLQLASLALQATLSMQDGARTEFIQAFAGDNRYVMEYLLAEVLDAQLSYIQDFLLETAILDRFTAPLCDAVTEQRDSQDTLARLERANLFLIPLDNKREWPGARQRRRAPAR